MPTVLLANDKSFTATADACVLDAARQAGLVLEHSCRTGRCGTCRARVLEGCVVALKPDLALTTAERDAGWMLTCASGAAVTLICTWSPHNPPAWWTACVAAVSWPTRWTFRLT